MSENELSDLTTRSVLQPAVAPLRRWASAGLARITAINRSNTRFCMTIVERPRAKRRTPGGRSVAPDPLASRPHTLRSESAVGPSTTTGSRREAMGPSLRGH